MVVRPNYFNDGIVVSTPIPSVIAEIYWEDTNGLLSDPTIADTPPTSAGVVFSVLTPPPPLNLPEGNTIGYSIKKCEQDGYLKVLF